MLFILAITAIDAQAQTACPAGFVKKTDFLPNGNYATLPTQNGSNPMNGNAGTAAYDPAIYAATDWGNGVNVSGKYYLNNGFLPPDGGFNFVAGDYTDGTNNINNARSQVRFSGDPAFGVPATPNMMIWNGNAFAGNASPNNEIIVYQRNLTGLIIGRQYTFWYYASSAYQFPLPNDPTMRIRIGGTVGFPTGTVVAGPLQLDDVPTNNASPLGGWVRQAYSFTATTTSLLIKVTDGSDGNGGDDLAITGFGLDQCQPLPVSQNVTTLLYQAAMAPRLLHP